MDRRVKPWLIGIGLLISGNPVFAEVNLSGFASIIAGRVTNGSEFLADYPKAGVYDNDWSFSPDTSIGVQLSADINEDLEFTVQAVSHGALDYDVEVDWAYLSYQINSEVSLQAGRKRLPLYYYSDYFDVGYAYYWIRPPVDNYTWQISNYNGLSLLYQPQIGEWDSLFNLYIGREDSDDNELLGMLSNATVDESWKNIVGGVAELSKDWLEFRITMMESQLDRSINDAVSEQDVKQRFTGASINLYFGDWSILTENNQYKRSASDIHVKTGMLSLGYQYDDFTIHVTHSRFKQEENVAGGDENHQTNSMGVRWDYDRSIAFKIQFDEIDDKGVTTPVLGDANAISLSMDIVF